MQGNQFDFYNQDQDLAGGEGGIINPSQNYNNNNRGDLFSRSDLGMGQGRGLFGELSNDELQINGDQLDEVGIIDENLDMESQKLNNDGSFDQLRNPVLSLRQDNFSDIQNNFDDYTGAVVAPTNPVPQALTPT